MPGVYRLACGGCDYCVEGHMSLMYVVLDDGAEAPCPHPLESLTAERLTGQTRKELAVAGRIVYRYALACLECGEMDYYGPVDISEAPRRKGHISSIIHQPTLEEARRHECRACGRNAMYPLCGDNGLLRAVAKIIRRTKESVPCPLCSEGTLRSEMFAKS